MVATKGGYHPGSGRPERLRAELEESFERLRTDTITLYYLHRVDPEVPLEESLDVLREYHDAGRIEHVGVSDVSVDQIERARAVVPIAAVQNQYNLAERKYEDVVDFCEREGLLFVPYYPLHGPGARSTSSVQARLAPEALALHRPDPRHALARAPEDQPGRARHRVVRRGLRQWPRRTWARPSRAGGVRRRTTQQAALRAGQQVWSRRGLTADRPLQASGCWAAARSRARIVCNLMAVRSASIATPSGALSSWLFKAR